MDAKAMTRKDFITLTFTLLGSAAVATRCSDDNTNTNNTGAGGTTAQSGGHAGTNAVAGHGGGAGTTGQAGGGAGGTSGATVACTDPLPETQVQDPTNHVHSVTVPASTLNATTVQTFTTSVAGAPTYPDHTHTVALTATELATLKGGGNVTVMSGPAAGHTHMYSVSCH